MRMGGLGIGGLLLVLLLSWATGIDFLSLVDPGAISTGPSASTGTGGELRTTPEEEKLVDFVDAVVKDAQEMWQAKLGGRYQPTRAVIFRDAIQSACGSAQSATGPFYCPGDQLVYLDLGFFRELRDRFGAPGDFAQAYVLAHELGHHVQRLLGIDSQVRRQQQARPDQENPLSVQARAAGRLLRRRLGPSGGPVRPRRAAESGARDRRPRGRVERRRRRSATTAFSACPAAGSPRIASRTDRPSSGSRWFRRGFERGDMEACETFQ